MSLVHCPECGHEISQAAIACPSCGRPINAPTRPIQQPVIVAREREEGFPPWAFIPIGILALGLIGIIFYAMSRNDETANSNLKVNVSTARSSNRVSSDAPPERIDVPSGGTTDSQSVTVPGSQTSVPSDMTQGTVVIEAKIANKSGGPQSVKNEKFYLLDKDLQSILGDSDLEPIEGQTLANSFGLSVLYPDRYGDFNRRALAAINDHIKYSGTTDNAGKAQIGRVEPDNYYLFGITKTGSGFAIWSNPVNIRGGENLLNLSPQPVTEMARPLQ